MQADVKIPKILDSIPVEPVQKIPTPALDLLQRAQRRLEFLRSSDTQASSSQRNIFSSNESISLAEQTLPLEPPMLSIESVASSNVKNDTAPQLPGPQSPEKPLALHQITNTFRSKSVHPESRFGGKPPTPKSRRNVAAVNIQESAKVVDLPQQWQVSNQIQQSLESRIEDHLIFLQRIQSKHMDWQIKYAEKLQKSSALNRTADLNAQHDSPQILPFQGQHLSSEKEPNPIKEDKMKRKIKKLKKSLKVLHALAAEKKNTPYYPEGMSAANVQDKHSENIITIDASEEIVPEINIRPVTPVGGNKTELEPLTALLDFSPLIHTPAPRNLLLPSPLPSSSPPKPATEVQKKVSFSPIHITHVSPPTLVPEFNYDRYRTYLDHLSEDVVDIPKPALSVSDLSLGIIQKPFDANDINTSLYAKRKVNSVFLTTLVDLTEVKSDPPSQKKNPIKGSGIPSRIPKPLARPKTTILPKNKNASSPKKHVLPEANASKASEFPSLPKVAPTQKKTPAYKTKKDAVFPITKSPVLDLAINRDHVMRSPRLHSRTPSPHPIADLNELSYSRPKPTQPRLFYNVELSNSPIFLRRTTVKPPHLHIVSPTRLKATFSTAERSSISVGTEASGRRVLNQLEEPSRDIPRKILEFIPQPARPLTDFGMQTSPEPVMEDKIIVEAPVQVDEDIQVEIAKVFEEAGVQASIPMAFAPLVEEQSLLELPGMAERSVSSNESFVAPSISASSVSFDESLDLNAKLSKWVQDSVMLRLLKKLKATPIDSTLSVPPIATVSIPPPIGAAVQSIESLKTNHEAQTSIETPIDMIEETPKIEMLDAALQTVSFEASRTNNQEFYDQVSAIIQSQSSFSYYEDRAASLPVTPTKSMVLPGIEMACQADIISDRALVADEAIQTTELTPKKIYVMESQATQYAISSESSGPSDSPESEPLMKQVPPVESSVFSSSTQESYVSSVEEITSSDSSSSTSIVKAPEAPPSTIATAAEKPVTEPVISLSIDVIDELEPVSISEQDPPTLGSSAIMSSTVSYSSVPSTVLSMGEVMDGVYSEGEVVSRIQLADMDVSIALLTDYKAPILDPPTRNPPLIENEDTTSQSLSPLEAQNAESEKLPELNESTENVVRVQRPVVRVIDIPPVDNLIFLNLKDEFAPKEKSVSSSSVSSGLKDVDVDVSSTTVSSNSLSLSQGRMIL